MLAVLASLIAGLALWDKSGGRGVVLLAGAVMFYLAVNLCSYSWEMPGRWQVFSVGIILVLMCSWRVHAVLSVPAEPNRTLTDITGTVSSLRTWGRIYVATIDAEDGKRYVTRMQFAEMMEGTRIRFSGITQKFRQSSGGFNEARFWKARGAKSWINLRDVHELPERFSLPLMRCRLSRSLAVYMPKLTGEYLRAARLGERSDELSKKHRQWGTSHLLAVSGFHVGIVVVIAGYLFGGNALILSVILWTYILLTGAAPSAMRAGLMFQAGLMARLIGRKANGVNSVSVAGVLLLLWRPFLFWDIGFRLSVLSALTIAMMPRRKITWLIISTVVFLVTFPQVAYTFRSVPAVGVILNTVAPYYFFVAFSVASCAAFLRLIHIPFMKYILLAVEGGFMLWEKQAETGAMLVPLFISWNYFTAWIGAGVFMFWTCRYFGFSYGRTLAVTIAGSLAAFMMFL